MPSDRKRKRPFPHLASEFYRFFLTVSILLGLAKILFDHRALQYHVDSTDRSVVVDSPNRDFRVSTMNDQDPPPLLPKHIYNGNISQKEAIDAYKAKFVAWKARNPVCATTASAMNFSDAMQCGIRSMGSGRRTPPLQYPNDAEEHFADIHLKMAQWGQHDGHQMHTAANYSGPWIENYWIDAFLPKAVASPCLHETFGPYIPLFLPWVDLWVANGFHYPDGFIDTLLKNLRPSVAYVTVSQGDMGISGYRELPTKKIPNVLVLSAGGYGHVPIPLLKQEESATTEPRLPLSQRPHTFVYAGSLDHAPNNLRKKMHDSLVASGLDYIHYYGEDWRSVMRSAVFNLVPRGYGRSAYHLMEALQSNCVPIYVYSDEPWIPYRELFDSIGYQTSFDELPDLAKRFASLPHSVIEEKEKRMGLLRKSHFTYAGAIHQIGLFLKSGTVSDLRCQSVPKRPR